MYMCIDIMYVSNITFNTAHSAFYSLTGNDLFLESEVHSCLVALLRIYCQEHVQLSVDFTASLPGLVSFDDL